LFKKKKSLASMSSAGSSKGKAPEKTEKPKEVKVSNPTQGEGEEEVKEEEGTTIVVERGPIYKMNPLET
jgi:hypothetical protein